MNVEERINLLEEKVKRLEEEIEELKSLLKGKPLKERKRFKVVLDAIEDYLRKDYGDRFEEEFSEGFTCFAGKVKGEVMRSSWEVFSSVKDVLSISGRRVSMLAETVSNISRVLILRALYSGPKSSKELSEITGLEGGQLYHHLRLLIQRRMIGVKKRGVYYLTGSGLITLLIISSLASYFLPPLEEEVEELVNDVES